MSKYAFYIQLDEGNKGKYINYLDALAQFESEGSGGYHAINSSHYLGRYQVGEPLLAETYYYENSNIGKEPFKWNGSWSENKILSCLDINNFLGLLKSCNDGNGIPKPGYGKNFNKDYIDLKNKERAIEIQEDVIRCVHQIKWWYVWALMTTAEERKKFNNISDINERKKIMKSKLRIGETRSATYEIKDGSKKQMVTNMFKITTSGIIAGAHLVGQGAVKSFLNDGKITCDGNKTPITKYMCELSGYDMNDLFNYTRINERENYVPIKSGNYTSTEIKNKENQIETSNLKKVNPDNTSSKKSDATVKSNSSGKIVIKDYNPLDFKLQVPEYIRSDGSIKQIDDTSSNSNIKELGLSITNKFVCEGATTSCTLGVSIGKLTSIENKIFKINNKNVITAMDNKVGNIGTFGNCKKTSPPSPCKFVLKENWNKYDSYFGIGGNAFGKITLTNFFITEKSQCKCVNGGIISIIQPQQEFVGNSRGFNKEESTIIKSDEISKSENTETKLVAKKTEVKKDNTTYEKNNCDIQKYNKIEKHKILGELRYRNIGGGRIEIDPNWVKNNIISYSIPSILQKKFPKTIYIHKKSYNNWNNVFLLFSKNTELLNCVISFDGVWVPRHIRWDDNRGLSNHTWGLAIDINAGKYPMGVKIDETNTDNIQVKLWNNIFRPSGFSWGNSYKDAMHFEILKL